MIPAPTSVLALDYPHRMPNPAQEDSLSAHDSVTLPEEADSFGKTAERQYYRHGCLFTKRSLRPSEYITTYKGTIYIQRLGKERLQNEGESLHFVSQKTNIPVPKVYGSFDVDDSHFLITEYIEGVGMSELSEDQKKLVWPEIDQHLATLHSLTSNKIGGPSSEIVIPPYRVMACNERDDWTQKISKSEKFVFCHNDLHQCNIIVDPVTLKINGIIDWEYAGFIPQFFEASFYKRLGPSVALEGEFDDTAQLLEFLEDVGVSS
ncbi:hypothetical protein N7478_000306 [Penicillium angulare]|uniref:uncharacterized protein n=1 Tax=Penicillium angulare TaxID=116970 RepID=UPI0025403658|nr:uncharacterized protein N7478_000306 [Penicillium angulare]KAJ5291055.1 hypothetical protein N7478_000306 [Penicillium angulare]